MTPSTPPEADAGRLPQAAPPHTNPYPWYAPRFWHGMRLGDWLRLMAAGGFRVPPSRWGLVGPLLATAPANSVLSLLQKIIYGRRIAATQLTEAPVFVIGHFRSGTTFLYELLARDPALAAPTAYDCFAASHFVLTRRLFPRLLAGLAPKVRPMDRMAFGFDRPQEDEFALLATGAPTIYRRLAFPQQATPDLATLDGEGLSDAAARTWRQRLLHFLQAQKLVHGRRLVVKSPPHTGRMRQLLELFAGARFVHIVRDPAAMFASAQHAWRSLELTQGFQPPCDEEQRDAMIAEVFARMYRGFRRDRQSMPAGSLCEVRYEHLVANPLAELARIYDELKLPGFEHAQPKFNTYLSDVGAYQPNAFADDGEVTPAFREATAWYRSEYGYD